MEAYSDPNLFAMLSFPLSDLQDIHAERPQLQNDVINIRFSLCLENNVVSGKTIERWTACDGQGHLPYQ